jgi:tubulin--tyrosine ligase
LQPEDIHSNTARSFWSSISDDILPEDWKENVFRQICQTSAEVFRAASQMATEGLVLLPGCFKLFALDFLIDIKGSVWLLEVNGGPAIPKEGNAGLLALGLFESITSITVQKLTQIKESPSAEQRMMEVLNDELKQSNIREIV